MGRGAKHGEVIMTVGDAVGMSVGLILVALAAGLIATLSAHDAVERNKLIGIRTRATKSSSVAWARGHAAARPALWTLAMTSTASAVAIVLVSITLRGTSGQGTITGALTGISSALALTLLVLATLRADRAAKKTEHPEGEE